MDKDTELESNIKQAIRLRASQLGMVLWVNVRGLFTNMAGTKVKIGVGPNGGSDLLGFKTITVTPDMVGKKLAVFCAIEVKTTKGMCPSGAVAKAHFKEQQDFVDAIVAAGGIGKIICSAEDL